MKIRNGFVSNSSSSSFIISFNKDKPRKFKVEIEVDLEDASFVDHIIKNVTDLERYMKNNYGYDEKEDEKMKTRLQKLLNDDQVIITGSFSNEDDDPVSNLLVDSGLKCSDLKRSQVIEGWEGGY